MYIRISRKDLIIFITVFALFCLIWHSLRPTRDDWNNFSNLRDLPLNQFESWKILFNNHWAGGHEKRTFFVAWFIVWPIAHLGSLAFPFFYALLLAILVLISIRTFQIIYLITSSKIISYLASCASFLIPIVPIGALWANNFFFVLPWYLYLELLLRLLRVQKFDRATKLIGIIGIFAGESGSLLFISSPLLLFFVASIDKKLIKQILLTLSVYILSFLSYIYFLSEGSVSIVTPGDPIGVLSTYFNRFWEQVGELSALNSWIYGSGRDRNMWFAMLLGLLLFLVLSLILHRIIYHSKATLYPSSLDVTNSIGFAYCFISISCVLLPMVIGVASGARPGPELRYHYLPSQLSIIILFSLLGKIIRQYIFRLSLYLKFSLALIPILMGAIYFSAAYEVRVRQTVRDSKLWEKVNLQASSSDKYFIIYNPHTRYLIPPYYSFAESDFQADWGILGYFRWHKIDPPMVFSDVKCKGSECFLLSYSNNTWSSIKKDQLSEIDIFASNLDISPERMSIGDFHFFDKLEDFLTFRNSNPRIES
jgi:hypothetical protein